MSSHVLVVLSNATEGNDEAFNKWYTNTHLPDVLKVKGFIGAQRFALSNVQMGGATGQPYRYLALYDVEIDDLAVAAEALGNAASTSGMYIDPSLDMTRTVAWFYTPVTGHVRA